MSTSDRTGGAFGTAEGMPPGYAERQGEAGRPRATVGWDAAGMSSWDPADPANQAGWDPNTTGSPGWDPANTAGQPGWDPANTASRPGWDTASTASQPVWETAKSAGQPGWDPASTAGWDPGQPPHPASGPAVPRQPAGGHDAIPPRQPTGAHEATRPAWEPTPPPAPPPVGMPGNPAAAPPPATESPYGAAHAAHPVTHVRGASRRATWGTTAPAHGGDPHRSARDPLAAHHAADPGQQGWDPAGREAPGARPGWDTGAPATHPNWERRWDTGRHDRYAEPSRFPPPGPVGQPGPAPADSGAIDLRNQVISRLRRMNALHAQHAWDRRNRDPLAPHGIAYFYADPIPRDPSHYTLCTATRMLLDGPEAANLPRLLYDLAGLAAARAEQDPQFDPRVHMADRCESMSAAATFVGLGVSTLDTPIAEWSEVKRRAESALHVPGRCFALLVDGTMVLIDRGGQDELGAFDVQSTHNLNMPNGYHGRQWRWGPELADLSDPATRPVWQWLGELLRVLSRSST